MKKKILGLEMKQEFGGFNVTMTPLPRVALIKVMAPYDLSEGKDCLALGSDLAAVCVTDLEGVEVTHQMVKVGKTPRKIVSEESYDTVPFETLSEILIWLVESHFLTEDEKGN